MPQDTPRPARADFPHIDPITTRWADNDAYGHVNNVVYYQWFDTVVNRWLIERGLLDLHGTGPICLVVETSCRYHAEAAFPQRLEAGLRVARVGNSSVTYEIAVFRQGEPLALADGRFVHVCVDRATRRPVPLPAALREALSSLSPKNENET